MKLLHIKLKVKDKGRPVACQTSTEGRTSLSLPMLILGDRRWWVVIVTPRPSYPQERDPVSILREAGWVSGPVWTVLEDLAPTEFRTRTDQLVAKSYTGCVSPVTPTQLVRSTS
jgi:hypothetical protein